jgi:hypothetical protein
MLTNLNDLRLKLRLASKALLLASCVALVGGLSGCAGDACDEFEDFWADCCQTCGLGDDCVSENTAAVTSSYSNNQCQEALDASVCPCN